MKNKIKNQKIVSKEGLAIILVAVVCLLLVVSMYIYVDKHLDDTKIDDEISYEQKEIPSFNKDKYITD